MTCIKLFRATPVRNVPCVLDLIAWGKANLATTASPWVFAAILLVCSFAVGCSSEKPRVETANTQTPIVQPMPVAIPPASPASTTPQANDKPTHKKTVRRLPATVTYIDKSSGVSFQYPRKYSLQRADSAEKNASSAAVTTNFVEPGGVPVVGVSIPDGAYPKTDFDSAQFNVSINKALTAEQCGQFAVPQEKAALSKMMIGDMELLSTEIVAGDGNRQEAAKYYHAFENGNCYEFALQVATTGVEPDEGGKKVDRDEIFKRLEKILATVKVTPIPAATPSPEVTASAPSAAATPAQ